LSGSYSFNCCFSVSWLSPIAICWRFVLLELHHQILNNAFGNSQICQIYSVCLLCTWPDSIRSSHVLMLMQSQGLAVLYFISSSSTPQLSSGLAYKGERSQKSPQKAGTASGDSQAPMDTAPVTPHKDPGLPPATTSGPRMNATFVTLARNSDLWEIARSIRQVEDRFNRKYHYDWVFLNDKPFDATFKKVTTALISGTTHYGEIPTEHWSFPPHIDIDKAAKVREDMAQRKIIYGDSVSYRHMCRFESGFFFQQPLMKNYEWYWRVEPSVELFCDIDYDPFKYMADHNKKYSFVISLYEYVETIPTLWDSVKKFMKNHPEHIAEGNSMAFLSDDGGETYNHCHMVRLYALFHRHSLTIFSGPTSRLAT
jgi:alpha 1,2-mannosyltransferase